MVSLLSGSGHIVVLLLTHVKANFLGTTENARWDGMRQLILAAADIKDPTVSLLPALSNALLSKSPNQNPRF